MTDKTQGPCGSDSSTELGGLSGRQEWSLDWLRKNGPAMRRDWRKADITATTMISLVNRGLVAIDGKKWKALDCEVQPNTEVVRPEGCERTQS